MHVLIKKDIATEFCVMNGAEATVVSWVMSHVNCDGVEFPVADVLFVKLTNPPYSVKLKGLPENVVPLNRTATTIQCEFPNSEYNLYLTTN